MRMIFHLSRAACLMLALQCVTNAQVPDLTAGGVPTDSLYWNMGPTGMKGWFYHSGSSTSASRQILVTTVDAGSPADGVLAVNDVILGASGTGTEPVDFTSDARRALADAINAAEANNPATLKLLRWRSGITTTVSITLETLGAYSSTAPYNCPKSAAILEKGVAKIMATNEIGGYGFSSVTLLAANAPSNPNNAARQAKAQTDARALNLTQAQIDEYTSNKSAYMVSKPWNIGYQLMTQAEYYLQTGDATVLPSIRARAILAAKGQSMFGTTGHQFAKPGAYGEINGAYGVGYGTVNNANMGCFIGLILAQKCGLNDQQILDGIERSSRFYGAYVNRGSIPYGEHQPGGGHESNGKCGQAALAFMLKGDRPDAATFYAKMATASATSRDGGHTGPYFNYQWAPLGANVGGEQAMATYFSRARWMYDLARCWDGTFEYNTYGQGINGGKDWSSANFQMSTAILLTYALPLRQTYITGKNQNPTNWLSAQDAEAAANAADYNAATRTTNELLSDLGSWSPPNRRSAANEIGNRTAEHASLLPTLHTMATSDANLNARIGACFALGEIAHDSSCPIIADLLDDPENLVRWASAAVIANFSQNAKMAQLNTMLAACASTAKPLLPLDPEDPIHLAHGYLVPSIFGSGGAGAPRGVLYQHDLVGIDRNLLYPALRAALATPLGLARSSAGAIYPYLSRADFEAVAGPLVDATMVEAPADRMFAGAARTRGIEALKSHNISEGVPLSVIVAKETDMVAGLAVLEDYAGSSLSVKPDPKVFDFCRFLIESGTSVLEAQAVLDAIDADQLPDKLTPFKSIDWIFPDDQAFNLPKKTTVLRVRSTDHAEGDSVYTWRKVHGTGGVSFTPNGNASAKNTTVVFDGVPGVYEFECTMSDSRGLTEVSKTVTVTLRDSNGNLPSNNPPTANDQPIATTQGTPTQIILTGSDPEGYALGYTVTSQPAHGSLSGTAPYLVYTAQANYSGADSFNFEVMDSEGQVDAATVNITVDALANVGLAVYEPFQYPAGALHGASGGAAVGFSGSWTGASGINLVAQSLPYGTLKTAGGSVGNLVSANGFGGRRTLDAAALAGNGLLDDGATLWFSVVMGHPGTNYSQKLYMALANNPFSTANNNFSLINDGPLLGSGVGVTLSSGSVIATQFRDASFGTTEAAHVFGNWSDHQGGVLASKHRLVVGRITWGASSDKIDIFLPYGDMLLPSAPSSSLTADVNQSAFDTLTFSRSGIPLLDEIRFGATYQSVLQGTTAMTEDLTAPTPDPMTFAVAPYPASASTIKMTATTAHDAMGVEYQFTCTAGGGPSSAWQTSATYTATGLTPGVTYSYTVKARDQHPGLNETAPSTAATAVIPALGTVPNVVGMPQETAVSLLTQSFFTLGTVTMATEYSVGVPAGHVLSQTPTSESSAAYGAAVNLVISIGPDPALPTLQSADIEDDQNGGPVEINTPMIYTVTFSEDMNSSTVDAADFTNAGNATIIVGAITEAFPGVFQVEVAPTSTGILRLAVGQGAVLQDAQGDALDTSAAIIDDTVITVQLPPVTVPNVVGMTQASAESAIVSANLVVESIYQMYDETVPVGKVISQSPVGGSSIPGQSPVDIVISLGPPPDTTKPVIATLDPADGANHVEVNDKLVVYFDEDVVGGTGNIILRNLNDYTEQTIPVNDDTQVFISGAVMTIDPAADLLAGTSYAIRIDPGVVVDLSGNPFAGINDNQIWNFSTSLTPNESVLFTEGFESPDVTAYTQGSAPANWVKASTGYNAALHGLTDKAAGDFNAADPNHQGYAFRYSNTGLTTAQGVIGTLTEGVTYRVEFDVIKNNATAGTAYSLWLMAFNPADARNNCTGSSPGTILASTVGNATTNGSFSTKYIDFTAAAGNLNLGKDIAVRLIGSGTSAIIDNVVVKTITPNLPDVMPPVITSFTPVDNTVSFPVIDNLVLTFNENIVKGSGSIILKNLSDATETAISMQSAQVIVTGNTLTINPTNDLLVDKFYAVRIPSNAVYDAVGNNFAGIDDDTLWSFSTGEINDSLPPSLDSSSPADGSSGVPYASNLTLTLSESVVAGSGNITIRNLTDSTELVIDVHDESQVTFHGPTVTINPAVYLGEGKSYAIRVAAGAVIDLSGNPFAGIEDDLTWNFTTTTVNPPTLVSLNPSDESVNVNPAADFTVTFDEPVAIGTGNVIIKNLSDATQSIIAITDASQISISGSVLTINPTSHLAPGRNFAVRIDAGAIQDLQGNPFAGITNDTSWNFISGVSTVGLTFFEDFEVSSGSPDVDATGSIGDTTKKTGPNWVRTSGGAFGSDKHGIVDESSGQFADPTGEQAYAFRYTNSGITTKEAVIGSLVADRTYTVSFYVVKDGHDGGGAYSVGLVTFAPGATRSSVTAMADNTSKVLATASGTHTGTNYKLITFQYTVNGTTDAAVLGHDVAVRIDGASGTANIDNVQVNVTGGADTIPPTLASSDIVDNKGGGPITANTPVTYTLTFSEAMNPSTLQAGIFSNAGTAGITVGAITQNSPSVFSVVVTPTTSGTLQLRVNAGVVVTDVAGNPLDTSAAILDNTTLQVDSAAAGVLSVATGEFVPSGLAGGPFSPSSKEYTLQNTGTAPIDWTAAKTADWVSLSASNGTLAAGASTVLTVSINGTADALPPASYYDSITISNTTNGNGSTTRDVLFTIHPQPTYVVDYNGNGNTSGTVPTSQIKTDGIELTLATNSGGLARVGHTFAGWNTSADGSGAGYAPGGAYTNDASVTLYAQWVVSTYLVTYDANGATAGTVPSNQVKTYGVNLTLATNTGDLAREGYAFAGWNTAADGSGADHPGGAIYSENAPLVLYAKWQGNSYTVTFDTNGGGAASSPSMQVVYGLPYGTLATVTRDGYTFNGWFTAASGGSLVTASTIVATADNHTLFAQWAQNLPEMNVARGVASIADGGYNGFSGATVGTGTQLSFSINNSGTADLTLGAAVILTQANCAVVINSQPASTVTPAGNTNLILTVTPSAGGLWSFVVTVPNNDPDENPYNWTIHGVASANATVSLTAIEDTYLNQKNKTTNYGSDTILSVWNRSSNLRYGLLRFNLSGLSPDTTIVSASLDLTQNNTVPGSVDIYEATGTWTEAAATWNSSSTLIGSTLFGTANAPGTSGGAVPTITMNTAGKSKVQNWVSTPLTNFGFGIKTTSSGNNAFVDLRTSEHATTASRPKLNLSYSVNPQIAEMQVTRGGVAVADGSVDSVSGTVSGLGTQLSYPIYNLGNANLGLTTPVSVSAESNCSVVVDSQPASSLAAFAGTNLVLTVTPTAAGAWSAAISIANSDTDESPYNWTISGSATGTLVVHFDANGGSAPSPASILVVEGSAYGALATTNRPGYIFNGWFTAASGGSQVTAGTTVAASSNHSLYAQWTPNLYAVTFNPNGGDAPSPTSKQVTYDSTYGALATVSRTGHTFAGWFTAASGGMEVTAVSTVSISGNHTLYARWTANSYTVSFDANGGDAAVPASTQVTFGSAYGALASTGRNGYTFAGWFTAASGGTEVTAASAVATAGDHTLYAQWTANAYTVSFDANGGATPVPTSKQVTFGSTYGSLATTSRTGYTFAGWFTSPSGGSEVTDVTTVATAISHTLYAQWSRVAVSVVTDKDNVNISEGGTGIFQVKLSNQPADNVTVSVSRASGDADVSVQSGVNLAFTTGNWNTYQTVTLAATNDSDAANGVATIACDISDPAYHDKNVGAAEIDKDTTLTVTSGGNGTTSPDGAIVVEKNVANPITATAHEGYDFVNWAVTSGAPTIADANSAATTATLSEASTIQANFALKTYTVSYQGNGNTGGTAPASQPKTHGVDLTLAANSGALAKTGYTFVGWNTAADGTGMDYAGEAAYTQNSPLALFAKWIPNTYDVTFEANGGELAVPSGKQVTFGSAYGTLATSNRSGYIFAGWFTAPEGGTEVTAETNVDVAENHTLYATWMVATPPVIVSLDPADGTTGVFVASDFTVTFDEPILAGTGYITIKNLSDATESVIDITDATQVSISGNVLVMDPVADLELGKNYAVRMDAGAVKDLQGSGFAGITNDTTWNFKTVTAQVVFSDDFEPGANPFGGTTPNVTTYTLANTSKQRNSTLWVAATDGFGSDRAGLIDETENSGANFTDPSGTQAYGFRYTNSGLTTAVGKIGALAAGSTIDVRFDVCRDGYDGGVPYKAALVLFDAAAVRTSMNSGDVSKNTSAVLAQVAGNATTNGNYSTITMSYTVGNSVVDNNGAGTGVSTAFLSSLLGKDIALRIAGATNSANIDNVQVTITSAVAATYTVSYNANNPDDGTAPTNQTKNEGEDLTLATNTGTLAKIGYTLTGWNTDAAGTGTHYNLGGTYALDQDITLYAEWSANTYTVTFDPNGGDAPIPTSKDVTFASTYGTLATTNRSGYTWVGWFTAASGGTEVSSATAVTTVGNHTLYAQWTAQPPFEVWAGGGSVTFTGDANNDGIADGLAWLLGSEVPAADARALLPPATYNQGALSLSFKLLKPAARGTAALSIQYSRDLGVSDLWTNHTIPVPDESGTHASGVVFTITEDPQDPNLHQVQATIPASAAGGTGKVFARLVGNAP